MILRTWCGSYVQASLWKKVLIGWLRLIISPLSWGTAIRYWNDPLLSEWEREEEDRRSGGIDLYCRRCDTRCVGPLGSTCLICYIAVEPRRLH
jgi:hypothetical protein